LYSKIGVLKLLIELFVGFKHQIIAIHREANTPLFCYNREYE